MALSALIIGGGIGGLAAAIGLRRVGVAAEVYERAEELQELGEALIDMLPRTTAANEAAFAPYSGGAVFNTAVALGRLGVPVEFFSGLSTDLFGRQLRATLAESNVGTRYAHL